MTLGVCFEDCHATLFISLLIAVGGRIEDIITARSLSLVSHTMSVLFVTATSTTILTERDFLRIHRVPLETIRHGSMENASNASDELAPVDYHQCTLTNEICIRYLGTAIFCIGIVSTLLSIWVFTRKPLRTCLFRLNCSTSVC